MAFLVDNLQYYLQVSITEKDKLSVNQKLAEMHGGSTEYLSQVSDSLFLKEIRISFASLELPPSSQTTATITKFLDL